VVLEKISVGGDRPLLGLRLDDLIISTPASYGMSLRRQSLHRLAIYQA